MERWSRINSLPVHTSARERGLLFFSSDTPRIEMNTSGTIYPSDEDEYFISKAAVTVGNDGRSELVTLDREVEIRLRPVMILRKPYLRGMGQMPDSFWPPASEGWYGRVREGDSEAIFTIQALRNNQKYWITISDIETGAIYESHIIQRFELGVLELSEEWDIQTSIMQFFQKEYDISRKRILQILDDSPPRWEKFVDLVRGIIIPDLRLGKNMHDTVSPLVPQSFPKEIREELMVFLAWIMKEELPDTDPVDYFEHLMPTPFLRALIMGYVRCKMDQIEPPPYVRLMTMAERKKLELPGRPTPDTFEKSPWLMFWDRVFTQTPNWYNRINDFVAKLNQSEKVITRLPVSRSAAGKSKKAWKKRFGLLCAGVFLRAHVKPHTIGLHSLVYFGTAHRWPHNHMAWITRLGDLGENPPYLQLSQMPVHAAERARRLFPNIMDITWSARIVNHDLYDSERSSWRLSLPKILDSVSETSTLRRLRRRYGKWIGRKTYQLDRESARVLDIAARNIYLSDLEHKKQLSFWGLTTSKIRSVLTDLQQKDVVRVIYEANDPALVSVLTMAQGTPANVCSLSSAFLEHTPTSLVMLGEECNRVVILTKMPSEDVYKLQSLLPERSHEENLSVRCLRPRALWNYTASLYQRLLKDDGTWNDDISGFLSQARSMRKTVSEGNV